MTKRHIVKYDYKDGVQLKRHEWVTYCGYKLKSFDWYFTNAQHAICAMEQNTNIEPCKKCTNAIIKIINDYHKGGIK